MEKQILRLIGVWTCIILLLSGLWTDLARSMKANIADHPNVAFAILAIWVVSWIANVGYHQQDLTRPLPYRLRPRYTLLAYVVFPFIGPFVDLWQTLPWTYFSDVAAGWKIIYNRDTRFVVKKRREV